MKKTLIMKKVTFVELHTFLSRKEYKLHQVGKGLIWVGNDGSMLAKAEPSNELFENDYFINDEN